MNKSNLRLLANWLIENNDMLVASELFNMVCYREASTQQEDAGYADNESNLDSNLCGAVGCALGWGPHSGIEELAPLGSSIGKDYFKPGKKHRTVAWSQYSVNTFGLYRSTNPWDWCFSNEWSTIDNTPKGAGIRILVLIGDVPYSEEPHMRWIEDGMAHAIRYREAYAAYLASNG